MPPSSMGVIVGLEGSSAGEMTLRGGLYKPSSCRSSSSFLPLLFLSLQLSPLSPSFLPYQSLLLVSHCIPIAFYYLSCLARVPAFQTLTLVVILIHTLQPLPAVFAQNCISQWRLTITKPHLFLSMFPPRLRLLPASTPSAASLALLPISPTAAPRREVALPPGSATARAVSAATMSPAPPRCPASMSWMF